MIYVVILHPRGKLVPKPNLPSGSPENVIGFIDNNLVVDAVRVDIKAREGMESIVELIIFVVFVIGLDVVSNNIDVVGATLKLSNFESDDDLG